MSEKLLEVKNLKTYFYTDEGVVKSVDDVSFDVEKGKTLGIVGESGCGKSITSLSIMQLVETPPGKIVGGEIIYQGENLLEKNKDQMRKIRGGEIAMIFQEPMTSLNPVFTVGKQIMEALRLHTDLDKEKAKERAIDIALAQAQLTLPHGQEAFAIANNLSGVCVKHGQRGCVIACIDAQRSHSSAGLSCARATVPSRPLTN